MSPYVSFLFLFHELFNSTFSVSRLYGIRWQVDRQIGMKWLWPDQRALSVLAWINWEKPHRTSVRIGSVPAKRNQIPPEYKSRVLPLDQSVQSLVSVQLHVVWYSTVHVESYFFTVCSGRNVAHEQFKRKCFVAPVPKGKTDVDCVSVSCTLGDWSSAQNFTGVCTQRPSKWIWLCWPNFWMHRIQPHLHKLSLLLRGHLKFPSLTICKERRSHQNRLIQTFQKCCLVASMCFA